MFVFRVAVARVGVSLVRTIWIVSGEVIIPPVLPRHFSIFSAFSVGTLLRGIMMVGLYRVGFRRLAVARILYRNCTVAPRQTGSFYLGVVRNLQPSL